MAHIDGPLHNRGRFLIEPVVIDIAGDSDNLGPIVGRSHSYALTQGLVRTSPVFARQIFRDERYRAFVVQLIPGEIAASHKRSSERSRVPGRNELEMA